jgi:hypothetical protein
MAARQAFNGQKIRKCGAQAVSRRPHWTAAIRLRFRAVLQYGRTAAC